MFLSVFCCPSYLFISFYIIFYIYSIYPFVIYLELSLLSSRHILWVSQVINLNFQRFQQRPVLTKGQDSHEEPCTNTQALQVQRVLWCVFMFFFVYFLMKPWASTMEMVGKTREQNKKVTCRGKCRFAQKNLTMKQPNSSWSQNWSKLPDSHNEVLN